MHPRIAICARARSGKTTYSEYLRDHHGLAVVSIAAPPKAMGKRWAEQNGVDTSNKANVRPFAQFFGYEGRGFDTELWTGYMIWRNRLDEETGRGFVCDDIRFPNEASMLQERGFTVIRLQVSKEERRRRCIELDGRYNAELYEHPTELCVDDINADVVLRNETEEDRVLNLAYLDSLVRSYRLAVPTYA